MSHPTRTCNVANRNLVQRGPAGAASARSALSVGHALRCIGGTAIRAADSHRARGQGGRGGSKSKSRIDAALEHLAARRTTTSCARRAGPAFGTSVMARPEEQLAPYRPSLRLLTPYIVARWPLRFCGPLLPCAEYPGLVKALRVPAHALRRFEELSLRAASRERGRSSPCSPFDQFTFRPSADTWPS